MITPEKGVFYCFSDQTGGDQLQLVAHIRQCGVKDAAQWIAGDTADRPTGRRAEPMEREGAERGFQPLDYLDPDHAAVLALGFEPEDARALGIGYAPRGVLRGTVAVPVRNADGSIAGYLGITEATLPPRWHL